MSLPRDNGETVQNALSIKQLQVNGSRVNRLHLVHTNNIDEDNKTRLVATGSTVGRSCATNGKKSINIRLNAHTVAHVNITKYK